MKMKTRRKEIDFFINFIKMSITTQKRKLVNLFRAIFVFFIAIKDEKKIVQEVDF